MEYYIQTTRFDCQQSTSEQLVSDTQVSDYQLLNKQQISPHDICSLFASLPPAASLPAVAGKMDFVADMRQSSAISFESSS